MKIMLMVFAFAGFLSCHAYTTLMPFNRFHAVLRGLPGTVHILHTLGTLRMAHGL